MVSAWRLMTELSRITEGVTAIIATHDPLAMILGQRTVELRHGRIRCPAGKLRQHGKRHGAEGLSAARVSAG